MVEGREFKTVGAATSKERESKWRLVQGKYKMAEEDDCKMRGGT